MDAIHHIRTKILQLTQADFAVLAGTTQPTVHRWETGELVPDLQHLAKIRRAAKKRRIRWKDRWFFDAPAESGAHNG